MSEYIERSAAIHTAEKYGLRNGSALGRHSGVADRVAAELTRLPAADVVPAKRSRWKYFHKQGIAVCEACSFERSLDDNFGRAIACPNCAAIMEGCVQ